ncbi:MAG: preprotein translocase subunit SecG [Gammaproteobacteria bacterium AqS3]|nr:preprotein translocase subunit SecG [Gammaproteobacteria bacterium AqS3]
MNTLLLVLYMLLSVALIALVLLQQGRGASMGAAFGGGVSGALFGPAGPGNLLTRSTAILAFVFIALNLFIAVLSRDQLVQDESLDISSFADEQMTVSDEEVLPDAEAPADGSDEAPAAEPLMLEVTPVDGSPSPEPMMLEVTPVDGSPSPEPMMIEVTPVDGPPDAEPMMLEVTPVETPEESDKDSDP